MAAVHDNGKLATAENGILEEISRELSPDARPGGWESNIGRVKELAEAFSLLATAAR